MLRTPCNSCRHGHHDQCQGVFQAPPEGGVGGAECDCKCRTSAPDWFCWDCGTPNERGQRVCKSCGREAGREADLDDTLHAVAGVLDRGIPDDRKLATINRLVNNGL